MNDKIEQMVTYGVEKNYCESVTTLKEGDNAGGICVF